MSTAGKIMGHLTAVLMIIGLFLLQYTPLKAAEKFVIGISQFAEHPALDAVRQGFEDELKAQGVDANIIYKNSQGDTGVAGVIAQKFVADKVDLIFDMVYISVIYDTLSSHDAVYIVALF